MSGPWITAFVLLVVHVVVNSIRKNRAERNLAGFTRAFHPEGQEEGFVDVTLSMGKPTATDGTVWFTLGAWHDRLLVGLELGLPLEIPGGLGAPGGIDTDKGFLRDAVRLRSAGAQSDRFLGALAQVYGIPLTDARFTPHELRLTAFSLNTQRIDPTGPSTGRLKVFFETNDGTYAELYLNFDTTNALVQFSEKDPEYRAPLIRILSA